MDKINRLIPVALIALILSACIPAPAAATPTTGAPSNIIQDAPLVGLTKQAVNAADLFDTVGDVISYRYTVTNVGVVPLAGPVTVQDNKAIVVCPEVNTVGNLNGFLDPGEVLVCASSYAVTQADLDARSVTNAATAAISGFNSAPVTLTVNFLQANALGLTKTANPTTFNQAGQVITYTFAIQNKGANTLGPTQFVINDDQLGAPFNCGADGAVLLSGETLTCTATYNIVQADLSTGSIINIATASGGGAVSPPAFSTITNNTIVTTAPSNLTPGTTISHTVKKGEWLIQIARCYGANYKEVIQANPHIPNPSVIREGQVLSVPRIGSAGRIYGEPCVGSHTVQSGETWNSIAQRYNADILVLQEANPGALAVGRVLKIPLNSAGGAVVSPAPVTPPTAIPITFPAGTNSIVLNGTLSATGRVRYVLGASQNQVLHVEVTGPANEVALAILRSNETALKPLDTTLTWNGTIPENGDYFIDIVSVLGAANKNFSMKVTLTGP